MGDMFKVIVESVRRLEQIPARQKVIEYKIKTKKRRTEQDGE
jgi:hypothetical protein